MLPVSVMAKMVSKRIPCNGFLCPQATYLVDSLTDQSKNNQVMNVGGPDDGLTMMAQGKLVGSSLFSMLQRYRMSVHLFFVHGSTPKTYVPYFSVGRAVLYLFSLARAVVYADSEKGLKSAVYQVR